MKPLKLISRSEANQQYLAGYLPDYKSTGWKLGPDGKHIAFTDGCGIGNMRLVGNNKQALATFPVKQIKRVRIVKRADGY
jgi:putative transposase